MRCIRICGGVSQNSEISLNLSLYDSIEEDGNHIPGGHLCSVPFQTFTAECTVDKEQKVSVPELSNVYMVPGLVDGSPKIGDRKLVSPHFIEGADDGHQLNKLGRSSETPFGSRAWSPQEIHLTSCNGSVGQ